MKIRQGIQAGARHGDLDEADANVLEGLYYLRILIGRKGGYLMSRFGHTFEQVQPEIRQRVGQAGDYRNSPRRRNRLQVTRISNRCHANPTRACNPVPLALPRRD
jgi:hypothetical protein